MIEGASWAIAPFEQPWAPVVGNRRFAVGRIWCVGRNYADHSREMGSDPEREPPFFFAKPADSLVPNGGTLAFPAQTRDLHHEVELAVAIGSDGRNLSPEAALSHIYGYAVALDMTRRDLQAQAKRDARPWEMGKAFDESCPIGQIVPASDVGALSAGAIELRVNGRLRQSGDLADMSWSAAECISVLSASVTVRRGDLILTGTPAGVGPVQPEDWLEANIKGLPGLSVAYVEESCLPC